MMYISENKLDEIARYVREREVKNAELWAEEARRHDLITEALSNSEKPGGKNNIWTYAFRMVGITKTQELVERVAERMRRQR